MLPHLKNILNYPIYACSLFVLFSSCHVSGTHKKGNWKINASEGITIPVDSITPNTSHILNDYRVVDQKELLSLVDQKNNNLNIYDLRNKTLFKRVHLQEEGPNGIGHLINAHFTNFDSIFVVGTAFDKIYLIDSSAKILKIFHIGLPGNDAVRELYSAPNGKPIFIGGKLVSFLNPTIDLKKNLYRLTDRPFLQYNLGDSSGSTIPNIRFPAKMTDQRYWTHFLFEPSFCNFGNKLAFCYPATDSIYVYDFSTQKLSSRFVPSADGYSDPEPLPKSRQGIEKLFDAGKSSYLNYTITYDPYRNLFYRFVFHPLNDDKNYTDIYRVLADKPITIQAIDADNFEVKGEIDLAQRQYYFKDFFVTPEGLYLSANNPNNPSVREDFLVYTLFKIDKNVQ